MNRDDIIRMAREAGFIKVIQVYEDGSEIVTVAPIEELTLFAKLVATAEREECACEAEGIANSIHGYDKHGYAEAIRARGDK